MATRSRQIDSYADGLPLDHVAVWRVLLRLGYRHTASYPRKLDYQLAYRAVAKAIGRRLYRWNVPR